MRYFSDDMSVPARRTRAIALARYLGVIAAALLLAVFSRTSACAKVRVPEKADAGGVRVILREAGGPMAAACVFVSVGAVNETADNSGVTSLLNNLVLSANPSLGPDSPVLVIERLGGTVEVETGAEYSVFRLAVPEKNLAAALTALGKALIGPPFNESALRAEKRHLEYISTLAKDVPVESCYRLLLEKTSAKSPYGLDPDGDPAVLRKLSVEDVAKWHSIYYHKENILVSLCADIDVGTAVKVVGGALGALPEGVRPASAPAVGSGGKQAPGVSKFDSAASTSGSVAVIGYDAPSPGSPDYPAVKLAEAVVALGMGSKLFRSLRVDGKLAYSFGSILQPMGGGSRLAFYVNAAPGRIDAAVDGIIGSVDALKRGELTEDELARARGKARGELSLSGDGVVDKALRAGISEIMGLGQGYWEELAETFDSIGPKDVAYSARKYMDKYTLVVMRPGGKAR